MHHKVHFLIFLSRSYSEEVKTSFKKGLISTGCNIEDIGLSLTPTVYYAQFKLSSDAIAMITASHNENGWTGVKMGIEKGLTHAPEEMGQLKEITLNKKFIIGKVEEKESNSSPLELTEEAEVKEEKK